MDMCSPLKHRQKSKPDNFLGTTARDFPHLEVLQILIWGLNLPSPQCVLHHQGSVTNKAMQMSVCRPRPRSTLPVSC